MQIHEETVVAVASRLRRFYERKQPYRIYHGSTTSTRPSQRHRDNTVDTSSLNRVLDIDVSKKTALVEPNVPMDALVAATLKAGLVPLVVMEFPGITVGGGFSGTSGESSSCRHGPFEATINWIEIVLPNGDIANASRTTGEKADLFWGAASAFGTLGVVTLLEVQLRDAKPYVQLTYSLHDRVDVANARIREEIAKDSVDYVNAIVLSKDGTVVCSGRLSDRLPEGTKPQRFTRSTDPWFYIHARGLQKSLRSSPSAETTEYIPLADYLFRYDRGGFWTAEYSFRYFLTPFNCITRFLLDPLMHTRTLGRAMHHSGLAGFYLAQDVGVPFHKVPEFADWIHDTLNIYPLWLCPLQVARDTPDARHGLHAEFADIDPGSDASLFMDFGIWGPLRSSGRRDIVGQNRLLEMKVRELGGKKCLYAHTYYTEEEFWAHYDRKSYDNVRAKYGADWMPSVYDKVKVDVEAEDRELEKWMPWLTALFWSIWPLRGLYGVLMTLLGSDYLLKSGSHAQAVKED
ncbi:hypothetical protein GE09DRAFT_1295367 [Coniochaeta sp. 2T2.1]|nr:hypothetical protein GE09DRAFT_1295367 [Coniochaeta sp. 2T2.1]